MTYIRFIFLEFQGALLTIMYFRLYYYEVCPKSNESDLK
jgi:hypothetical protein